MQIELVARQRPVQVPHQLQALGDGPPLFGAEAGDLGVARLSPRQGHGGVLDHCVIAGVDLGVADGDIDIDALVGDLERRFQLGVGPFQQLLGFGRTGGGEQEFDLRPADPSQPDLRHMFGQPAAEPVEDFSGQPGTQLASQLSEPAQANDRHEERPAAGVGLRYRDAIHERGPGRVAGGQGHGEAIGHGVEGDRSILRPAIGGQADRQIPRREADQGVCQVDGRRRGARLGRAGLYCLRSRARLHPIMKTANLLKLPLIGVRRG